MSAAEELRTAAAKLRARAAEMRPVAEWWSTSPWTSLMHPGLAEPLAAWLESVADQMEAEPCNAPGVCNSCERRDDFIHADAVARVINGGAR